MPSGLRIKHTLKRCNLHLHNGGALVNMNGLSSLMSLSDKDQNKCFSLFFKRKTSHTHQCCVTSPISIFIKRADCKCELLDIKRSHTGASALVFVSSLHLYLQPHSNCMWPAARPMAAGTCGQSVNQIQTFHSSGRLMGFVPGLCSDLVGLFSSTQRGGAERGTAP